MVFALLRDAAASLVSPPRQDHVLALALRSGADERLALEACDGRNAYGLAAQRQPDEVFFSSSTATSISPAGLAAAAAAHEALECGARPFAWFDSLRARVKAHFAAGRAAELIFAPSGTDCESLAVMLAQALRAGPIVNLLVGPEESGRGVALAAGGRHFLPSSPFGPTRKAGERRAGMGRNELGRDRPGSDGLGRDELFVDSVALRDRDGRARPADELDAEVFSRAGAALAQGRNLILHLLEGSKTGLSAPSLQAARRIAQAAPDQTLLYADCCQARVDEARIGELLDAGCVVAVTGSKFFAGPPFSGALLVPAAVVDRLPSHFAPAEGLADFSSLCDWSPLLRERLDFRFVSAFNLGLGLRWEAALAEIARFAAAPPALAARVAEAFRACAEQAAEAQGIALLARGPALRPLLSFAARRRDGAPGDVFFAKTLQAALRSGARPAADEAAAKFSGAPKYHLGQPVAIGPHQALRLALSAPQISDVAERFARGGDFAAAFAPLAAEVEDVFAAWRALLR